MSQCQSRSIELADVETRQGTGTNACGGTGHKGTKLCDRNFDHGDSERVTLLVDDVLVKGNSPSDGGTCVFCARCAAVYAERRAELGCASCLRLRHPGTLDAKRLGEGLDLTRLCVECAFTTVVGAGEARLAAAEEAG